jgi:hypothetical protein
MCSTEEEVRVEKKKIKERAREQKVRKEISKCVVVERDKARVDRKHDDAADPHMKCEALARNAFAIEATQGRIHVRRSHGDVIDATAGFL